MAKNRQSAKAGKPAAAIGNADPLTSATTKSNITVLNSGGQIAVGATVEVTLHIAGKKGKNTQSFVGKTDGNGQIVVPATFKRKKTVGCQITASNHHGQILSRVSLTTAPYREMKIGARGLVPWPDFSPLPHQPSKKLEGFL